MRSTTLSLALLVLAAAPVLAQQPATSQRAVTVQAGGFNFDRGGDATIPMAAVRMEWQHNRYLISEVGFMGTRPSDIRYEGTKAIKEYSNLFGLDLGVQVQLPTPYVQPYVGVANGIFGYFQPAGGDRFFRPTSQVLGGLRAPIGSRLGLRGEVRPRFDQFQDGGTSSNIETTLGLTIRL